MNEVELKFYDIDEKEIISKLESVGISLKYEVEIEAIYFDKKDFPKGEVLRVRRKKNVHNGDEIVEVVHKSKTLDDSKFKTRVETEFCSNSFEKSIDFLKCLGYEEFEVTHKIRKHFEFGNYHFELDTQDPFPTFLEIEAQSDEELVHACKLLNLDFSKGSLLSPKKYYETN